MSTKVFGYARVSTEDQSLNMQLDALTKYGVDEIYQEKESGKDTKRPQLALMLSQLREGDKVVIYKLDRISRSTKHLIELSELFAEKKVDFVSLQDGVDTSTAIGRFFFRVLASIAELERDILSERTKAGLAAARARGRLGGAPSKDKKQVEKAIRMYRDGNLTISEISEATSVSKATLYRYLKQKAD